MVRTYLFLLLMVCPMLAGSVSAQPLRIGLLSLGSNPMDPQAPQWSQLLASLRALGWVEGKTAHFDTRFGEGNVERLEQMAVALVRERPALVFVSGNAEATAMHKATQAVPVVMIHTIDPVANGYAQSMRRSGGNMTGLSGRATGAGMIGKLIEMLREGAPRTRRIAIIFGDHQPPDALREAQQVTAKLGLSLVRVTPGKPEDFGALFARLSRERVDAYLAPIDGLTFPHRVQFCAAAAKARMPGIAESGQYAEAGCFLAYGANLAALSRRAAAIGDKILRGARPADLPIEQPMHFDLVINGKTARALGLKLPATLLVRAEKVIE